MSKTLGANANLAVAETEALEPVLILKFEWPGNKYYASKLIDGVLYKANILEFSGLNQTVKLSGVSSVTSIEITLADPSEGLKDLINVYDLTGTDVTGYLYYDGLSGGVPGTTIFKGKIVAPYTWNDGSRTLRMTVESYLKSNQVGFSMQSGQFTVNNEIAVGQVWPIVFGKPAHVPAVLAQKKPAAILKYPLNMGGAIGQGELYNITGSNDFEITDWTTVQSYNVANSEVTIDYDTFYVENSQEFEQNTEIEVSIDGVIFKGSFNESVFTITEANAVKYTDITFADRDGDDPDFYNPMVCWLPEEFVGTLVDHYCYFYKDSSANTTLDTAGDEFIIRKITRHEGRKIWMEMAILDSQTFLPVLFDGTVGIVDKVRALPQNGLLIDLNRFTNQVARLLKGRDVRAGSTNSYGQLIATLQILKYIKGAFWNRKEGTEVRQWDSNPDIYVANAVPSTALVSVYGVRKINDQEQFVPIPSSYYTVDLDEATTIPGEDGPTNVTTLRFDIPLSAYKDQGWKDEIYVTVESTLTDNGIEAIKYLLDTYTTLTTDSTTFTAVASELANYEAHFAILEHFDAIELCEKIAYQLRCGLLIDSGTVKIVNLAKEGTSQFTFNSTNIEMRTLEVFTSQGQQQITRLIGKYKPTYEPDLKEPTYNKRIKFERYYENNIATFGLIEDEIDFFIYRNPEQVDEVIEFWGNRNSKIWKIARFRAFHDSLKLDLLDKVTFTLDYVYLGSSSCTGTIIGINNSLTEGVIEYTIELSMEAGNGTEDDLYWNYVNISAPTNPADNLYEISYDPQTEKEQLTVDEFIKVLQELTSRQRTLARNKNAAGFRSDYGDIATMDILTDGASQPPQYSNIPVDLTNNQLALYDGELVPANLDGNGNYHISDRWAIHSATVKAINDGLLEVCFTADGTEYETFNAIKPFNLSRLSGTYNGVTYTRIDSQTRTASDGTNSETQTIIPPYEVDEEINIAWDISSGRWIDLNTDARTWVAVCEE